MVNAVSGHKSPVGASVYSSIAGDAWYRAQLFLQDQKLGHYMHIPPKTVFFAQIFGSLLGVPIDYAVIRWVIDNKGDYISGKIEDPNKQWTGQVLRGYYASGTQYVLIVCLPASIPCRPHFQVRPLTRMIQQGPQRLFRTAIYAPLPYGFLLGAFTPALLYLLSRRFPKANFHLWNCTIFFCSLSNFYGNVSTGYLSGIIGGFIVMYWAYRHHYELWARYNYILAAAFDSGYNLTLLIMFLCFTVGATVKMPNWWGNDVNSPERCFALADIPGL